MNPDNLLQFLQSQMSPSQAVSTGVAHDEINSLIYKKKEIEPSLLDFINESVATSDNIKPENTTYAQALSELVERHGSPHINQMDIEGFKKAGWVFKEEEPLSEWQKNEVKKHGWTSFVDDSTENPSWEKSLDTKTGKWNMIKPRAFFKHANFKWRDLIFGAQPEGAVSEDYVPVDTINIGHGNTEQFFAELAHAMQTAKLSKDDRKNIKRRFKRENEMFGENKYDIPFTLEYKAHEINENKLRREFKSLLDSLTQPISVESLFQNQ